MMKCCQCGQKLDLMTNIKGRGTCGDCGTEQIIKKIHTFFMVVALIAIIIFLPFGFVVQLTLVLVASIAYLFFSQTEKLKKY
jgi:hypothetical protein